MRRFVAVLYFALLTQDSFSVYASFMFSPTVWAQILFDPLPIKVRPFDLLMGIILVLAAGKRDAKGRRFTPMRNMQLLAVGTMVFFFVYGVARGGDIRAASWQVYLVFATILASFTLASVFRTPEHYLLLLKVYVAAAFYRAIMCFIFYLLYVRPMIIPPPGHLSTHDDTVLWTFVIMILLANAIEIRKKRSALYAAVGIPILLVAIQLNNRRIAWVSLAAALVAFYALLRPSNVKRRVTRWVFAAVPVMLLYVVVGWGRTEKMFKPLAALASVSTVEDASTKARNVENLGLIATANYAGWFTGTGFGHKYVELSNKYTIAAYFELWQYVPHNSVLGLFAFTGFFGFVGFWLRIPTAVFIYSRMARMAERPIERAAGILGVVTLIIC